MAMEIGSRELLILISHLLSSTIKRVYLLLMFSTEVEEFSLYFTFSNDSINMSFIEFTQERWKCETFLFVQASRFTPWYPINDNFNTDYVKKPVFYIGNWCMLLEARNHGLSTFLFLRSLGMGKVYYKNRNKKYFLKEWKIVRPLSGPSFTFGYQID